jgi:hypothetical protein
MADGLRLRMLRQETEMRAASLPNRDRVGPLREHGERLGTLVRDTEGKISTLRAELRPALLPERAADVFADADRQLAGIRRRFRDVESRAASVRGRVARVPDIDPALAAEIRADLRAMTPADRALFVRRLTDANDLRAVAASVQQYPRALSLLTPDQLADAVERYHSTSGTAELAEARDLEAFAAAALALVGTAERALSELRAQTGAHVAPTVQRL